MTKIKKIYILSICFITLLSFIAVLYSCNGADKRELIVRKWKCENVEYTDTSIVTKKDIQDLEIVRGILRNETCQYFADGHFEASVGESIKKGSWKIDEEEKFLTLDYEKGKVRQEKYEIISLSESQMTLKVEQSIPLVFTYVAYTEKF